MLGEQQEAEQRRVGVVGAAAAADDRRDLALRGPGLAGQAADLVGQGDVVLLEDLPDEIVLAGEMAIERALGELDPPGDVPDGGAVDALLDEQVDRGGFDAVPGIDEAMAWHGPSLQSAQSSDAPFCACCRACVSEHLLTRAGGEYAPPPGVCQAGVEVASPAFVQSEEPP